MSTLTDLFSRDPLDCTEQDIEALVVDFRAKRHLYNTGVAQAGRTKKPAKAVTVKLSTDIAALLTKD